VELERKTIKMGYEEEENKLENLQSQVVEMKGKIEPLLTQVQSYKNAAEEVEIERDNIRKGYDEEKNKVEDLESHVAELKSGCLSIFYICLLKYRGLGSLIWRFCHCLDFSIVLYW
jgi:uncharacterized coiled-coil DUF342 family protein